MKEFSREGEQILEDRQPAKNAPAQREFVPRAQAAVSGQNAEAAAAGAPAEGAREEAARRPEAPARQEPRDDFGPAPMRSRSFVQQGPRSGMVRLFVNIGGMDNARPGDIAGMIYNTAKIPSGSLGTIEIFEKCSYVEVPEDHVETVMTTVAGTNYRGRDVRMDLADRQEGGGERPRRSFGPRKPGGFGGGGGGYARKPYGKSNAQGRKPYGGGGGGFKPRRWED